MVTWFEASPAAVPTVARISKKNLADQSARAPPVVQQLPFGTNWFNLNLPLYWPNAPRAAAASEIGGDEPTTALQPR